TEEQPAQNAIVETQETEPLALETEQESQVVTDIDEVNEHPELSDNDNLNDVKEVSDIPGAVAKHREEVPEKNIDAENADVSTDIHQSPSAENQEAEQPEETSSKEAGGDKYQLPPINDEE